ncbi:dihydrolipoyl dehydrogenase [Saccharolobus solfataricus]|uniref:Dihydrolipoamide dehydrogenase (PdhD-3) n=3 Tax=Saccharolobus solfataricus TaxID=2287 RepID=Q97XZ3_SACS2|nr:dihydrolipoyl dehydrogenase [Saccharolobus solfataricus]AAK41778.1 Dihydrolipoamide dehydrogenase (pdhD-3) [Saccharolobus solfataricus P2]AKA74562.1 dihydrolipoyl dehydrogenase [Saccharolobus solfataricus]AKA77258.1 dihydrolipoyl dehydrogenase [Saccharolobus solfataricus]AKA79950.1 dihydrolipoyl dehydrogenase [Saccharolobus solfataricus]AZF69037.1 dihydrolipoyl dehydrogenase [Saccharolobus solfataricus]
MKYDVVVIGAGGAGYHGAFRLAKAKYNVLMADPKGELGGNCLYSGCVPSKTVREVIQTAWRLTNIANVKIPLDFSTVQDRKDYVQELRFKQHKRNMSQYETLTFYKGYVKIKDPTHVIVKTDEGKEIEAETRYMIIASGAETAKLRLPGVEYCLTSDDIFGYKTSFRKLPQDMVIIGAGYIGLEIASIFRLMGVQTHIIEMLDRALITLEDQDIVNTLLSILKLNIKFNSPVTEVKKIKDDEYEVIYSTKDGSKKSIFTNSVVLAAGRRPVIPEGAREIGLSISKTGIVVDETMKTNIPNVFATGDANGLAPYYHAAVRMSIAAANNIMANGMPVDYVDVKSIPVTIYTIPSLSYVGILPSKARKMGIEIVEAEYNMEEDVSAQIYGQKEGVLKLIFERGSMRLIGAWMIGVHSQYLINELGLAVAYGLNAKQLASFAEQHPSTNEIISYTARKVI